MTQRFKHQLELTAVGGHRLRGAAGERRLGIAYFHKILCEHLRLLHTGLRGYEILVHVLQIFTDVHRIRVLRNFRRGRTCHGLLPVDGEKHPVVIDADVCDRPRL